MTRISLFFLIVTSFLAVPAFPAPTQTTEKAMVYTVHRGDSLWRISDNTWGAGKKWPHLYKANQEGIHDPNLIFPGQNLVIPEGIAPVLSGSPETSDAVARKVGADPVKAGEADKSSDGTVSSPSSEGETQEGTGSGSKWVLWVLGILALAVGLFWLSQRRSGRGLAQRPEPLSSYRPPERSSAPAPSSPAPVSRPSPSFSDKPAQTTPPTPAPTPVVTTPPTPSALPVAASAADTYVQQGLFEEAAKVYRGILERDPNNTEVARKLMDLEDRMRRQVTQEISQKELPLTVPPPDASPTPIPSGTPTDTGASSPTQAPEPYLPPEAESIVKEEENRSSADGTGPK